jgi:predicted nucleic acid-binding protein
MNVVDSSGWLEYFTRGPNADLFGGPIEQTSDLVVPALCLFEVFKCIIRQRSEGEALTVAAAMQQGQVVDLTADLALAAARLGARESLPLADSIILATAREYNATLWTQDANFEGMAGVRYVVRRA